MKYFTVSDIHDHFSLMRAALGREGFDPSREDHVLVLCGDAFYSGPEPGELFEYLSGINSKAGWCSFTGTTITSCWTTSSRTVSEGRGTVPVPKRPSYI